MRAQPIRYCSVVVLLLAAYAVVSQTPWFEREIVEPHLGFVARGTGFALGVLGQDVNVEGTVVHSGGFAFKTARGCDAIGAGVLVCSLIFAFPVRIRSRLAVGSRLRDHCVEYYNADRVHTRLGDSPIGRVVESRPSANAGVVGSSRVGRASSSVLLARSGVRGPPDEF